MKIREELLGGVEDADVTVPRAVAELGFDGP
jgi:hypothetical protein